MLLTEVEVWKWLRKFASLQISFQNQGFVHPLVR